MCTVTLTTLEEEKGFILTSSRDEARGRETIAPEIYWEEGVKMLYPRDEVAGGTWIGVSEKKKLICLLNGGFEKHKRTPPYRMSRGLIVKRLLAGNDFRNDILVANLNQVEPFTLIVIEWKDSLVLSEMIWDGEEKHLRALKKNPQIWSSAPLYRIEEKKLRETWFSTFREATDLTPESLLDFHLSAGKGNKRSAVVMDRGEVRTQSISQVYFSEGKLRFFYRDLVSGGKSILWVSENLELIERERST